jgi:predicted HicB family RNase H-like nuclease
MTKINLHGSVQVGPYKGYVGQAEYYDDDKAFHGEVLGTRAVIHFTGRTPEEVTDAFAGSVDDYLAFCAKDGEQPEKPFSGKFLVRISSDTHRVLVSRAQQAGQSLNQFIAEALDQLAGQQGVAIEKRKATKKPVARPESRSTRRSAKPAKARRSAKQAIGKSPRRP